MWLVRKERDGATIGKFVASDVDSAKRKVYEWAGERVKFGGGSWWFQYGKMGDTLYTILNIENSVLCP